MNDNTAAVLDDPRVIQAAVNERVNQEEKAFSSSGKKDSGVDETSDIIPWLDPPDEAAFQGLAGEIVRALEPHTEADPVALLIQFLVAFGSVIGSAPHFNAEADYHALNLFAVLVGATSKGRKGTSWGHVRRLFERVDELWTGLRVQAGLSSGEGLIWAVRDQIVKLKKNGEEEIVDPGVDDKRLLVLEAEFASTLRVLGRDGNTLSATIRQAWDTGDLRALTKNNPAKATGAHVSIVGHVTRDELLRYLTSTETGNGFGNRFLWLCVRRSKCLPEGGRIEEVSFNPLVECLHRALEFAKPVGEIKRDDEAREIWFKVYPELSKGKPGLLGAVTSRAEAQVMRLACLYALLDMSYFIAPKHLKAALALWEYCETSTYFIFGDALGDPVADEVLRALRVNAQGLTKTEIRDLFGRNKETREIERALAALLGGGRVRKIMEQSKGRPTERWFALRASTT